MREQDVMVVARWQLRSQQQLAKQLAAVEAQLLRGKVPDVPVDLLGA